MRLLIAVLLLALPALCVWAAVASFRARRPVLAALYVLGAVLLLLGNPLPNAYLLAPVDAAGQRRLFERARQANLLGADDGRVREVLGKPWKVRTLDDNYSVMLYAPCKVCMASYGAPFIVYLASGKVQGFKAGTGEVERVERP
jgi:hypothetical protein